MNNLINWINLKNFISVHSFALYVTLWLTVKVSFWAGEFAYFAVLEKMTGGDIALVIGAVVALTSALQGYVLHIYTQNRKGTE